MSERLLFDTDVLIDYLRGVDAADEYLESRTGALLVSSITIAELYSGVREGNERRALSGFLHAFEVVPVDQSIAEAGGLFRRSYGRSHNVGLADALIAATAENVNAQVVTLNRKHFPMLQNVIVPYRKSGGV